MLITRGKKRIQCSRCGFWFAEVGGGYLRHIAACVGGYPKSRTAPVGHSLCSCGRFKRREAEKCSRCCGDVAAVDLEILRTRKTIPIAERKFFAVGLALTEQREMIA